MKNRLKIEFDRDAMSDKDRCDMEEAIEDVVEKYGWKFSGSGADVVVNKGDTRTRDMQFDKAE